MVKLAKPKNFRTDSKTFRIRNEKVAKYVEELPFGEFANLINNLLESHYKIYEGDKNGK